MSDHPANEPGTLLNDPASTGRSWVGLDRLRAAARRSPHQIAVAREYARYYLGREAGSTATREMDIGLIQAYCSM